MRLAGVGLVRVGDLQVLEVALGAVVHVEAHATACFVVAASHPLVQNVPYGLGIDNISVSVKQDDFSANCT